MSHQFSLKEIDEGIEYAKKKIFDYNMKMQKVKSIGSLDLNETMLLANLRLNRDITQATLDELEKMKEDKQNEQ